MKLLVLMAGRYDIVKGAKIRFYLDAEKNLYIASCGREDFGIVKLVKEGSKKEYFDRINSQESYTLFLRKTKQQDQPYYTLEVEPGGVIWQKRTEYDRQKKDIGEASEFLRKWQAVVQKRLTRDDCI